MLPIIDAHHHIWRQQDLPWLAGPMVPRIFGPYEPIRRDYAITEYLEDLRGSGVEKSVYVQANWTPERFEDEVAWVMETADRTGWPHAIVGYADFCAADVRPQLDRLVRYRLLRGVRMQLHWHENPAYRFAASPRIIDDDIFRRNVERLAAYDLTFDLQVFPAQIPEASDLAAANPGVTFVLVHAGMLEDLSERGSAEWKRGIHELAGRPNVVAKLSGLGTFIRRYDPAFVRMVAAEIVKAFGAERCMLGSNFPIEKLWTDFGAVIGGLRDALAPFTPAAQQAICWGTAERVYRPASN